MNDAIISLNWGIGKRLSVELTGNNKPEYGKKVVAEVSKRLEQEYGSGFDKTSISRMIKFYQEFPDFEKVATLSQQLTWSHFVEILPIQDELKRDFYAAMCMQENWSVRTLRERKKSMLYERTAISKKPEETIKNEIAELRDDGKMKEYSIFGESDKEAIVTLFSLQINGIQGSSKEFAEEMEKREDALCGEILKKIETHEELRNQEMKKIKDMAVFMNTNGMEVKK